MVGGARVRGQWICIYAGARVSDQRAGICAVQTAVNCKVVPELLHALYSGMLLHEVKGQVQLV